MSESGQIVTTGDAPVSSVPQLAGSTPEQILDITSKYLLEFSHPGWRRLRMEGIRSSHERNSPMKRPPLCSRPQSERVPAVMTAPASAAQAEATVSGPDAVPDLTVDVYANGEELIADFAPGTLTDPLQLPAGTTTIQVFGDGDNPTTRSRPSKRTGWRCRPERTPPWLPTSTPTATRC